MRLRAESIVSVRAEAAKSLSSRGLLHCVRAERQHVRPIPRRQGRGGCLSLSLASRPPPPRPLCVPALLRRCLGQPFRCRTLASSRLPSGRAHQGVLHCPFCFVVLYNHYAPVRRVWSVPGNKERAANTRNKELLHTVLLLPFFMTLGALISPNDICLHLDFQTYRRQEKRSSNLFYQ